MVDCCDIFSYNNCSYSPLLNRFNYSARQHLFGIASSGFYRKAVGIGNFVNIYNYAKSDFNYGLDFNFSSYDWFFYLFPNRHVL